MSKLFKKYQSILQSPYIEENDIISLRKALNGYSKNSMTDSEKDQLLSIFRNYKPAITPEQAAKGLKWLTNLAVTPTGRTRKNNPFNEKQYSILANFDYFLLVGLEDCKHTEYRPDLHDYQPIYRCYDIHGNYFDYIPSNRYQGQPTPLAIVHTYHPDF